MRMKKKNKRSLVQRFAALLASGAHPTIGGFIKRLRLHEGTAVHQRITELRRQLRRKYGVKDPIPCYRSKVDKQYRYFMVREVRDLVKQELAA